MCEDAKTEQNTRWLIENAVNGELKAMEARKRENLAIGVLMRVYIEDIPKL
mgnify:FL=1